MIGRRFDPDLLAATIGAIGDLGGRLEAMQALDLVYQDGRAGEYVFKHALVRDALYDGLLSGPRRTLHGAVAEEIERRSGNRLPEVAEVLAHHYEHTEHANKAFAYLALAGKKSFWHLFPR